MTCTQVRSLLDDYVDRELSSQKSEQVAQHLELCPDCRSEHDQMVQLRRMLSDHTGPEPDEQYWTEVQDLILARTVERIQVVNVGTEISRKQRERVSFYRSLMAVAASLAIFFTALWLTPDNLGTPGSPWLAGAVDAPGLTNTSETDFHDMISDNEREMIAGSIMLVGSPGLLGGSAELSAMLGVGPGR